MIYLINRTQNIIKKHKKFIIPKPQKICLSQTNIIIKFPKKFKKNKKIHHIYIYIITSYKFLKYSPKKFQKCNQHKP